MKRQLSFVFLYLFPLLIKGQSPLKFITLENERLSTNTVLRITTDIAGLTWILTDQGFASFDGSEVRSFTDTSQGSYTSPTVLLRPDIVKDKKGNLYAWKYGTGLMKFNTRNGRYEILTPVDTNNAGFRNEIVNGMWIDQEDIAWIASRSGLIKFNIGSRMTSILTLSDQNVSYLDAEGHDRATESRLYDDVKKLFAGVYPHFSDPGKLWVNAASNIWLLDIQKGQFTPAVIQEANNPKKYGYILTSVLDINKDTLAFTTIGGGLGIYLKNKSSYHFLPHDSAAYMENGIRTNKNMASSLYKGKNGFYVGYGDALPAFFDRSNGTRRFVTSDSSVKGLRIFVDEQQRVWAYSRNRIQYSFIPHLNFSNIEWQAETGGNFLWSIAWNPDSSTYSAGIHSGPGVFVWSDNFRRRAIRTSERHPLAPPGNLALVWDVEEACGRSWAIIILNELQVFDKGQYKHYTKVAGLENLDIKFTNPEREALDLLRINNNELLILAAKGDVYRITGNPLNAEKILSLKEMDPASLWGLGKLIKGREDEIFITDYKTVYKYNTRNKAIQSFKPEFRTMPMAINFIDLVSDSKHNLWLLSRDNEIVCYDGSSFDIIHKVPLRFLNTNSNLAISEDDVLMAGETNSIVVYNIPAGRMYRYDENSGLKGETITRVLHANGRFFVSYSKMVQHIPVKDLLVEPTKLTPYISTVSLYGSEFKTDSLLNWNKKIRLNHDQNFLSIRFSAKKYDNFRQVTYWYRVPEMDTTWVAADYFSRNVSLVSLRPGTYTFEVRASLPNSLPGEINEYTIIITPAWWQTWWCKLLIALMAIALLFTAVLTRINFIRKRDARKAQQEKEILELEAKALRAQMNPHFVFNSLNSIKSLIQQKEEEKSITYLTTFSKLIRGLFNNADKKEISLFDEIETCRLYLQLESMRFDTNFKFSVETDPLIDLKSIQVPALIIQPFIENAIWHGIVPRGSTGTVVLRVRKEGRDISIEVEDNGIGRQASQLNKAVNNPAHHSKGVNLTQSRLKLDNLLQNRRDELEIDDLYDTTGKPCGTKVIITLREEI